MQLMNKNTMRVMKHHHLLTLQFDEKFKTIIAILTIVHVLMEVMSMAMHLVVVKPIFPQLHHQILGHVSNVAYMQL